MLSTHGDSVPPQTAEISMISHFLASPQQHLRKEASWNEEILSLLWGRGRGHVHIFFEVFYGQRHLAEMVPVAPLSLQDVLTNTTGAEFFLPSLCGPPTRATGRTLSTSPCWASFSDTADALLALANAAAFENEVLMCCQPWLT